MTRSSPGERLRRLGCPFCGYTTTVSDRLGGHLEREHPEEVVVDPEDDEDDRRRLVDATSRGPGTWECNECGSVVTGTSASDRNRPVECSDCDRHETDLPTGVDLFVSVSVTD